MSRPTVRALAERLEDALERIEALEGATSEVVSMDRLRGLLEMIEADSKARDDDLRAQLQARDEGEGWKS